MTGAVRDPSQTSTQVDADLAPTQMAVSAPQGTAEQPCDWCNLTGATCPGIAQHCAAGDHCTSTDATCNADWRVDDHSPGCHFCQAMLPERGQVQS